MKLFQAAKDGKYAHYYLEAENRKEMLEFLKLYKDMEEAETLNLKVDTVLNSGEVRDDTGETLPRKFLFSISPK